MNEFKLSALDQTPVPEGLTGGDALRKTNVAGSAAATITDSRSQVHRPRC